MLACFRIYDLPLHCLCFMFPAKVFCVDKMLSALDYQPGICSAFT